MEEKVESTVLEKGAILCFGELLLRLSPDTAGNWLNTNRMPVYVGGAELNVATALAMWKLPVRYFTALPENFVSKQILAHIAQKKIDSSPVHFSGTRIGTYYLPEGTDMKNAGVIYDRALSAFATLAPGIIQWDKILEGVSWLHFSAICPALSIEAADLCTEMLQAAVSKNITISIDLNYRSKLWQYGNRPDEIMPGLAKYCDIIMGNVWAAQMMLAIPIDEQLIQKGEKDAYLRQAEESSALILKEYPRCKAVFNTFRFDNNQKLEYYTTLYTSDKLYVSQEYQTTEVVDKVGSGDCFMAGIIYGYYNNFPVQNLLEFATKAAYRKLFIKGDAIDLTAEAILQNGNENV